MVPKAIAAGNCFVSTCSPIEDCHAGLYSATPAPIKTQKPNKSQGVAMPWLARIVSRLAPTTETPSPAIATFRLSNMSATAPAGTATSISGSIIAVCTSATMLALPVRRVISQATPTPRIN